MNKSVVITSRINHFRFHDSKCLRLFLFRVGESLTATPGGAVMSLQAECALDRFRNNIPPKPYCAHNKSGKHILNRDNALRFEYIQVNTPKGVRYLVFDCDFDKGCFAHELFDLPAPTFSVINTENGHSHNFYELSYRYPVKNPSKKSKPLYETVITYFKEALRADIVITKQRYVVKNPLRSDFWRVWIPGRAYTLTELVEYIPAEWSRVRNPKSDTIINRLEDAINPDSRNCTLFAYIRHKAYQIVNEVHSISDFENSIETILRDANGDLTRHFSKAALPERDIRSLKNSMVRWVWKNRDKIRQCDEKNVGVMQYPKMKWLPYKEYLKEKHRRQAAGGSYAATLRGQNTILKINNAQAKIQAQGRPYTMRELAVEARITERTLRNYRHLLFK
jgi:hypothetical protein